MLDYFAKRMGNAIFDVMFYDVSILSFPEFQSMLELANAEGMMLVIHPHQQMAPVERYRSVTDYLEADIPEKARETIVIPGVGSSALGAAALAKDVAQALQQPVTAIVTGMGAKDMISEGMSGFFLLGSDNREKSDNPAQQAMAGWLGGMETFGNQWLKTMMWGNPTFLEPPKPAETKKGSAKKSNYVRGIPECMTLMDLFRRQSIPIRRLIAHSKGSLNIENVLWNLPTPKVIPEIITFGCAVELPKPYQRKLKQYVGSIDLLGLSNSGETKGVEWIQGKSHTLNRQIPTHMPLSELL